MTDRTDSDHEPDATEDAKRERFIRALNQMTPDQLDKFAKLVTAMQEGDRDTALGHADALGVREEILKILAMWGCMTEGTEHPS